MVSLVGGTTKLLREQTVAERILIIDDIQSVRNAMRAFLCPPVSAQDMVAQIIAKGAAPQRQKLQIDEASQGEQGVAMVRDALQAGLPYDLVFVDMLMPPGIDGIETVGNIRQIDPEARIVVCSALSGEAMADEIRARIGEPVPPMIQKPLTPETNIKEIVDSTPSRRAAAQA
jgi:CheY-like chemotaxis protein